MRISRLKVKHVSSDERDDTKRTKLRMKLRRSSLKTRQEELGDRTPRKDQPLAPLAEGAVTNRNGNQRGMHNAGDVERMRKVRAMRNFYGPKMPKMQCNTCQVSSVCPQYRAGYECAFLPFLKAHRIEDESDLVEYMKNLLGANMRRIHVSTLMETASGAAPSLELSEQLNLAFSQLKQLTDLMREGDGELEFETNDESIIKQIFGGLGDLMDSTDEDITSGHDDSMVDGLTDDFIDAHDENVDVNESLINDHERFSESLEVGTSKGVVSDTVITQGNLK